MYEHKPARLLTRARFLRCLLGHFALVAGVLTGSLLAGMAGYVYFADMRTVDAFLNASMLLGGMGPVGDHPIGQSSIHQQ